MNKRWLTYFYIVVGLGLMLGTPAWADLDAGLDAYVRGDYETALAELRPLAEQGVAKAQYILGLMYYQGQGVPQDYVLAHMWANLAASQGGEKAVILRDLFAIKITPAQLAEAQRLAREWKPSGE